MPGKRKEEQQKLIQKWNNEHPDMQGSYYNEKLEGRVKFLQNYLWLSNYADVQDGDADKLMDATNSKLAQDLLKNIATNINNWEVAIELLNDAYFRKAVFGDLLKNDEKLAQIDGNTAAGMFRTSSVPDKMHDNREIGFNGGNTQYTELTRLYNNKSTIPEKLEFLMDYHISFTAREQNGEIIPEAEKKLKEKLEEDFFDNYVTKGTDETREVVFKTLGTMRGENYARTLDEKEKIEKKLIENNEVTSSSERSYWLARKLKGEVRHKAIDRFKKQAVSAMEAGYGKALPKNLTDKIKDWIRDGFREFIDWLKPDAFKSAGLDRVKHDIQKDETPNEIKAWSEDKAQRILKDPNSEFGLKKANEELIIEFNSKHINKTYENALDKFNTKRLSAFRQESRTHAGVRVAAENMMNFQNSAGYGDTDATLKGIQDPQAKKEYAKKWLDTARTLNYEADHYAKVKTPWTFAGSDRRSGAIDLRDISRHEYEACERAIAKVGGKDFDLTGLYKEIASEKRESAIREFEKLDLNTPTEKKNGKSVSDQIKDQKLAVLHTIYKSIAAQYSWEEMQLYPENTDKGNYYNVLSTLDNSVKLIMSVDSFLEKNWENKDNIKSALNEMGLKTIMNHLKESGVNIDAMVNPERAKKAVAQKTQKSNLQPKVPS